METDITKLQSITLLPGFKNNDEATGSFQISGTFNGGSKIITQDIILPDNTDIADIIFKGRANGGFSVPTGDPRSNNGWFKRGRVWVRADGSGYSNYPIGFLVYASISGNTLTISAAAFKQLVANLSLTAETVEYKVIDYSVF